MLNTNNLLHKNILFTECTINTIFTCNTNSATTQVTEADWLMRSQDNRSKDVSKTQPPLFVLVTLGAKDL